MTISSELLKLIREYYRISIYEGGRARFSRNMGAQLPRVCIEDSNIRLHMASRASLRQVAAHREHWMRELRLAYDLVVASIPQLNEVTIHPTTRVSERPVLWFYALLWFIRPVDRRFRDGTTVYVSAWDRETPPAKHLKHLERYHRRPPEAAVRIRDADHLRELFASPYLPEHFDAYMHQKPFVDAFARYLTQQLIAVYYTPPPAAASAAATTAAVTTDAQKMLLLHGHTDHRALLLKEGGARTLLENPAYSCHCMEADLSVVFWCNLFSRGHDVEVMSRDGDILFCLLMHSRYRVAEARPSSTNPALRDFHFDNTVYLCKDHRSFEENEAECVDRSYVDLCREPSPNETPGAPPFKEAYLARLEERWRQQQQEMNFLDATPLPDETTTTTDKKRKRPSKVAKTLAGQDNPSNAEMRASCDILYTPEGGVRFERYEIFNINVLFQAIYDHALTIHDARLASAPSASVFLPIESFCAVAALCGTDYVEKPRAIGAQKILESYFKNMNAIGNLVYAVSVDTSRHATHAAPPSSAVDTATAAADSRCIVPYDAYLRLTIDPNAVFLLLRHAFLEKNKPGIPQEVEAELQTTIANCRYHLCYFANDYKKSTPITDCFDRDPACRRSIYGYELVDARQPPSPFNVRRTANICDCFVAEIRQFTATQSRHKINLF
jgi:hypothetical protein